MDRLKGKVALITGGAKGLGASIAKHFFNEGAKIILCDINIDQANERANELGGTAYYMDVSNSNSVKDVFSKVKSNLSRTYYVESTRGGTMVYFTWNPRCRNSGINYQSIFKIS